MTLFLYLCLLFLLSFFSFFLLRLYFLFFFFFFSSRQSSTFSLLELDFSVLSTRVGQIHLFSFIFPCQLILLRPSSVLIGCKITQSINQSIPHVLVIEEQPCMFSNICCCPSGSHYLLVSFSPLFEFCLYSLSQLSPIKRVITGEKRRLQLWRMLPN